jgi:hypothetical protein
VLEVLKERREPAGAVGAHLPGMMSSRSGYQRRMTEQETQQGAI